MDLVKGTTEGTEQRPHGWQNLSSGAALSAVLTTDYTDYTDISSSPIREIRVISGQIFGESSWAVGGSVASEFIFDKIIGRKIHACGTRWVLDDKSLCGLKDRLSGVCPRGPDRT